MLASADHDQRNVICKGGREARSPYSWLVLLLAFWVFAWGTSYKLSLYEHNPHGSVMPAKLCNLSSDKAKSQVDDAVEVHEAAFSGFPLNTFLAFAASFLVYEGEIGPRIATESLAPLQAAPILHLRPPPTPTRRIFL